MRIRHLLLLLFIPFIGSCGMSGGSGGYTPKDDTIRFVTDTICADLVGLYNYKIGKTTYKQVLRDKTYKDCTPEYRRKSSFYDSDWVSGFGILDRNEEKTSWVDKNANGIKSLSTSLFKIDDIYFNDFEFAFLNDTLVAIYFMPDNLGNSSEYDLKKYFKNKYGSGSWKKYDKNGKERYGDTNYDVINSFEEIKWKGTDVELMYYKNQHFVFKDNKYNDLRSYSSEYYLLFNPKKYPEFIKRLKEASKAFDEQEKAKKEATLNSL